MNVVFSLILLAAALGCIVFLLTRRENARRSQYGPSLSLIHISEPTRRS